MSFQLTNTSDLSVAILNAQVNGSSLSNLTTILDAVSSRTDEINICGLPCPGTCESCVTAQANLTAFYAPEAPQPAPAVLPAPPTEDEEWEEYERAARARDEADESRRTGMWADNGLADIEHRSLADDNEEDDDITSWDMYDDRQDDYYEDDGYGLDWNESGYFD